MLLQGETYPEHWNSFGEMFFLMPPMTHMCLHGNWTQVASVKVHHFTTEPQLLCTVVYWIHNQQVMSSTLYVMTLRKLFTCVFAQTMAFSSYWKSWIVEVFNILMATRTVMLCSYTGRYRAWVWGAYGECGARAYNGVPGRAPSQGLWPPKAEYFVAFAQHEELANLSYDLFLQNKKYLLDVWGPWPLVSVDPQCAAAHAPQA